MWRGRWRGGPILRTIIIVLCPWMPVVWLLLQDLHAQQDVGVWLLVCMAQCNYA